MYVMKLTVCYETKSVAPLNENCHKKQAQISFFSFDIFTISW